jgi:hypothetical protein
MGSNTFSCTLVGCKLLVNVVGNFVKNLILLGRRNFNLVFRVQQNSLEDSNSCEKGNRMALLASLSNSALKDSYVVVF